MQKSFVLSAIRITLLSAAAFTAFAWQPASAADSVCKGLAQADCEGNAQCRWQAALTRKDGVQVSAHCRKGTKKNAPAADAVAPVAAPTDAPVAAPAEPVVPKTPAAAAAPVVTPPAAIPVIEKKTAP
ncbi:hypothetical protein [Chromatium okenii]|uniref:hypothetical protein n=1 Tax=Chromatium okenii TaxID=61644 RepID=UPI0026EAC47A|nr:hypothetical protein [Chromatium okenii]MBV5310292.1 hypothetical protein [Chromatium okenii]